VASADGGLICDDQRNDIGVVATAAMCRRPPIAIPICFGPFVAVAV
jgi:hypothetical protein